MSLGVRLKKAREKSGYSQSEVAEKLNISRQAVSKWENGWTSPDIDNLILLSKLYETSTDALLMETPEMIGSGSNDSNISGEDEEEPYDSHEDFMLVIIAVIGCMFPGVGFFITIVITAYCILKKRRLNKVHIAILILCFLVNVINAWSWLNSVWFHIGRATVEKVALID